MEELGSHAWRDAVFAAAAPIQQILDRYAQLEARTAELRAILAPLLDDTGEIGAPCLFCHAIIESSPHDPDCPVLRRDELLGRI